MYCAYVQRTSLAVGSVSVSVSLILETLWRALKRLPPRNGLHHHPPPLSPLSPPLLQLHHFTKSPSLSIFVMLSIARYTVSEHRHGLTLHECTNTTVLGVTISNTGGDGVYIFGAINTELRDVRTDGAYRNGLSIISGHNL